MPAKRLSMRKMKEVLRLKFELHLKNREIARSCLIPHSTVANYLRRAGAAGLSWPLPPEVDDAALERRLWGDSIPATRRDVPLPDFAAIHAELRRHRHVTLQLLWQEYQQVQPDGYQYSQFCERYRRWAAKLDLTLRQEHRGGEKLFVDHAGPTVPILDPETGQRHEAVIFVAVLGASNYTYAEATGKRDLADWISSHVTGAGVFGRRAGGHCAGQLENRRQRSLLLRAGSEPHLSRSGRPLWPGDCSGSRRQAPRQGQSRVGGPDRRALDSGRLAPTDFP